MLQSRARQNNHSLLAQRLKETEDSLQSLHTSMHADTHGSIMQMMGRLNHQEASSILQSLVPLLGGGEVGILLAQILRDARGFKSSDALHLVEGLTQIMISSDQIMLFPNCSELLPNATAYQGTLALLKNMKAGDRDTLIGELYEGLENGPEALIKLMRHIFMEGEDGSVVELLTQIASTMIGDQGDDEGALLELAGCLMKTAIKRGQKMGGSGNHSAGSVLSQLFEHLPSEIEHIMHQESHTRRTSKGIRLYHEEEEEDIRSTEVSGNSDTLTDDVGHDSSSRHKLQRHTDGTSVECQTEDPQGLFGSLQEAANRPLLSSEDSIFGDIASDSLKKVALTTLARICWHSETRGGMPTLRQ